MQQGQQEQQTHASGGGVGREVLHLAVPAFFALVAEPLFLMADSAIVGRLGVVPLAGLGVASAVLQTAVGICVFLAYATTAVVGRHLGAGRRRDAAAAGIDGLWLAVALGIVLAVVVAAAAGPLSGVFGASAEAHESAVTYLRVAALGLPGMLVVLAVTGALRGFRDTRTPLLVATIGFAFNLVLNVVFVLGLHHGIAGSALGTSLAQTSMGLALAAVLIARSRAATHGSGIPLRPHPGRVLAAARNGIPLVVRTAALRASILLTVWAAAATGNADLAAYQLSVTVWNLLAFTLDALAIAAQALVAHRLGAGDRAGAQSLLATMLRWGVWLGVALGLMVWLVRVPIGHLFSPDDDVVAAYAAVAWIVAVGQLASGYVFVADGILMGAGDTRYLAVAMSVATLAYVPLAALVRWAVTTGHLGTGPGAAPGAGLTLIWASYVVFMVARAATLWWRLRGDRWARLG